MGKDHKDFTGYSVEGYPGSYGKENIGEGTRWRKEHGVCYSWLTKSSINILMILVLALTKSRLATPFYSVLTLWPFSKNCIYLVSLLGWRNFFTKGYKQMSTIDTYERLKNSALHFMNENHFKRFLIIIRSTGFIISLNIEGNWSLAKSKDIIRHFEIYWFTTIK